MSSDAALIPCEISRGAFSAERIIQISRGSEEEPHMGACSFRYCFTAKGERLKGDQPPHGEKIKGMVAARRIRDLEDGTVLVSIPDGAVLIVDAEQIKEAPKEPSLNVPIES